MSVADQLGFGPKREVFQLTRDGIVSYQINVTPNSMSRLKKTESVILNEEQFKGYEKWIAGELIQRAMPFLSASDREILMTGIGPESWDKMFKEEE